MEDTYKHKGLRRQLVESLRQKGIRDERVLSAIDILPRHFFLDDAFAEWAYTDKPFQIGKGQTISQPFTVAYQTELLEIKKRERVLEIGTGSGYQAAILAIIGARVFTVERHAQLHDKAKKLLKTLKLGNIRCFHRDGFNGLPEFAPYSKILVTAGATDIPQALLDQLEMGGKLVIPVGKKVQTMYRITRTGKEEFHTEKFKNFRFVPFLKGLD